LPKSYGQGAVRIAEIVAVEATPRRFLRMILGWLDQADFIESRRDKEGDHLLARSA
jgi:DNA-binding IscR family transcriptional regulator